MVADGTAHESEGKVPITFEWHGERWTINTYIMANKSLAFPLVLGLDFLGRTGVQLNVAAMNYELKVKGQVRVYPFLQQPEWEQPCILKGQSVTTLFMAVQKNEAEEPETLVLATDMKDLIARHPPEVHPLLTTWTTVCSETLGRTNQTTHRIITTDDIPVRSKAEV